MRSTWRSFLSLLAAVLCTAVVYTLIVNALRNPVSEQTASYQAIFTDVSGVRPGADVRRQGVQVGKVTSIGIERVGEHNVAELGLEISRDQHITTATRLSVKLQNLTGTRYIDIGESASTDTRPITRVPLQQTTGSFDMTQLFAGMAPVLRTLQPADINNLTEKLSAFLNGDGAGAADLIADIRAIASKAADRQQAVASESGCKSTGRFAASWVSIRAGELK